MNSNLIEKIIEIIPTLYLNQNLEHLNTLLFKVRELIKYLSNYEKIVLYHTELSEEEFRNIIELSVLLQPIWDKDYGYNKKQVQEKKEFIEIYLDGHIKTNHLKIVFLILNDSPLDEKYQILKDIVMDAIYLQMLNFEIIDKLIIKFKNQNINKDICKFIIKSCKEDIFTIKSKIKTSYAKELASTSDKQLRIIVNDNDFLSNHIKTRLNFLDL